MNITNEIAKEIGGKTEEFIKQTPKIQIYANHNLLAYQWRDGRKEETANCWDNEEFKTRGEIIRHITEYIKSDIAKDCA